eukprot:318133-Hanusia_phi.AAC.6
MGQHVPPERYESARLEDQEEKRQGQEQRQRQGQGMLTLLFSSVMFFSVHFGESKGDSIASQQVRFSSSLHSLLP